MADIIWYKELESTNDTARQQIDEHDNLSVIAAMRQTSGRGQGDHKWHSLPGENITATFILKPLSLPAADALSITCCVTKALREYLLERGVTTRIKWPNDIWAGESKICGILIENVLSGHRLVNSIVGIGLNINQLTFPSDLPNPISLALLTGRKYDVREELEALHGHMSKTAPLLESAEGRNELKSYFKANVFNVPEGLKL